MRKGLPVWTVAMVVAASGCISTTSGPDDAPTADGVADLAASVEAYAIARLVQDHDHAADAAAHAGAAGVEAVAFAPGREGGAYPDGEIYNEIAVKGGYAYVTFGPRGTFIAPGVEAGFVVYDVHDPSAPRLVGRWLGQPLADIEVSDDGAWVYAPTQRNGYPYPYTINVAAGLTGHFPRGTYVVDVSDKTAPRTAAFAPLPTNGPHTVTYYVMPDGTELLIQCTYDIVFTDYPESAGQNTLSQKVVISRIDDAPGGGKALVPLSVFQLLVPDQGDDQYLPHDASVHVEPATGRVIMDVAYWDLGLVEVDITDPADPMELSRFDDTAPSAYTKAHLARVFPGTIGGRLVAVLEPEIASGEDAGQYTFIDVTDAAAPTKLGHWSLPGEHVIDQPFVFSPHNFDLVCGDDGSVTGKPIGQAAPCASPRLVLAHFHGGLWVVDAGDPTRPSASAFFFPPVDRENIGEGYPFTGFFSALVSDGWIYAPETWTGLHVLRLPGAAQDA